MLDSIDINTSLILIERVEDGVVPLLKKVLFGIDLQRYGIFYNSLFSTTLNVPASGMQC